MAAIPKNLHATYLVCAVCLGVTSTLAQETHLTRYESGQFLNSPANLRAGITIAKTYVPGAHGGSDKDGTPLVQYDVKKKARKVIAFLHPFLFETTGYIALGTFSSALSPEGDKVLITWNGNTGTRKEDLGKRIRFNSCALTVVHIPESERKP